jgi:predicted nucleotidyltransferase
LNLHSIHPDFPLDPVTGEILSVVVSEAALAGIDAMLVGATARDLLLTHVFGMTPQRATYDVDFPVAVDHWDQFEQLRSRLAGKAAFRLSNRMQQRLYFRGLGEEDGYPLDLVPFGGVAQGSDEIAWPPDMKVIMNVAGYPEVLRAAEQVTLAPGLVVRVASLPGLAILKLVAWAERGAANAKDAHDLYQLMTNYAAAGNIGRLYEAEFDLLEAAGYDPEIAGACLLGKDAARLSGAQTRARLLAILERAHERLTVDMAKSIRHAANARTRVQARLERFSAGLRIGE